MRRIENIAELVADLEEHQAVELRNDLEIRLGESLTIDQIKKNVLETCYHNIDNLGMHFEKFVIGYYSIYEIEFTEEFQDDVYFRNREWLDILFFLFKLYGYDYVFDCYQERLVLGVPEYIDFRKRAGIFIDPHYGELLDSFFYHENEREIITLYQREKRSNKIKNLIQSIKATS